MLSKSQESQYARSLIEASLDPLVTISTEGKITDMNQALANITGMSREQLTGSDFFDYFTEPQKAREVYQEVFAMGSVTDSPLTLRHKNGKLTDVLFNGSEYKDNKGKVKGVVIVARDVTAQKQASQYARSLIEASLDPLFTINTEGKITDINNASIEVTGTPREKLIGTNFFDYFTDPAKAREGYELVFAKGFAADFPLTLKDHKLTDVLFNGSVYKDEQGKVLGIVVVARDITEQKRIETEMMEAKIFAELATELAQVAKTKAEHATSIAEDAVKAKQQFLSNMSHEIRTPMNAIIGFTKVLLKTDLASKQHEYLSAIKTSGDALIVLINDILDLAKVDAGKMTFEQTPFRMSSSISAMLHLFETKIQEKNLQLITQYDHTIPEVLVGDPVRLHQIILNLVSNAVKFTPTGSITVSVALVSEEAQNAQIEFSVTDTGIGIPVGKIDSIFENFQQASSGTSRLFGGTGLGLAIVKQLVEHQGGKIKVVSEEGLGTTFSFQLSFLKSELFGDLVRTSENHEIASRNIKVLIVEDIPINQLLMQTILEEFGFEGVIASNGRNAIDKIRTEFFDIILMDLQMPLMNGFEATQFIREELHSNIPIIAVTADVTTVDVAKCRAIGMNDYIAKPIDEHELYTKIISYVKKISIGNKPKITTQYENRNYDLKYLKLKTKDNNALLVEMISLFLDQTPLLLKSYKSVIQESDWVQLQSITHKIVPTLSIFGISKKFEKIASEILELPTSQFTKSLAQDMVAPLEDILLKVCNDLKSEINKIKYSSI